MPTVADYDVVSDTAITLSAEDGGVRIKDFPLETPGIDIATRSLVSFMMAPAVVDGAFNFRISIINASGTTLLVTYKGTGGPIHVKQEVINEGVLQPNGNTLRIEVTGGSAKFSDIMLWYQTNV